MIRAIMCQRDGLSDADLVVPADRMIRPRPDAVISDDLPRLDAAVSYDDLVEADHDEYDRLAGQAVDFAIVAVLCLCAAFAVWVATIIVESEFETLAPTAAEVMAADFDLERKLAGVE